ncbi:NAD-dependent epimerase/dehydratase family protein [Salsipaludibacter albus]|uniref:NAD-dependent epimerase/dehydratase family protein n=1 Tax=Salsipaludibacter albus TaxID=2849650 RepID=UPI001EE4A886|nr:NAD-dependent epimerase/dehydratase family protein [Salsipaludibacter albus]
MATIAITGISGLVGRHVQERLVESGHRVVGIDTRAPETTTGLVFREADVRSRPDVERALADVDAVVHLVFVDPVEGDPDRSVNVGGSQVVVDAAVAAGVSTLVLVSSAMVYGAFPDNPVPLDESAPLRAGDDFPMAAHKRLVEEYLAETAPDGMRTVVLRPAMVVGADADILLTRALQGTRLLTVRGHRPPMQFVHVDDLAAAVVLALEDDGLRGAYNVGSEGWLSFDEAREMLGRRAIEVPEEVAFTGTDRAYALGLSRLPASALPWIMHPWVVDPSRLVAAGWRPRMSNRDAAALLATEVADRVEVAGLRTDRRTVKRAGVAAASVAGGILAVGLLSRRRRNTDPDPNDSDSRDRPGDTTDPDVERGRDVRDAADSDDATDPA